MAIDYDEIASDAIAALEEVGQPVVVHKPGIGGANGGYTPGVGAAPTIPPQDIEGIGGLFGYKAQYIDGTSILQGDQRMLLAPKITEAPQVGWTISANSKTYRIVSVERVAPAGVVVLYKLQLRGA